MTGTTRAAARRTCHAPEDPVDSVLTSVALPAAALFGWGIGRVQGTPADEPTASRI